MVIATESSGLCTNLTISIDLRLAMDMILAAIVPAFSDFPLLLRGSSLNLLIKFIADQHFRLSAPSAGCL